MLEIDVKTISQDGVPYEKFLDGIKNAETKKHYTRYLRRFLGEIPPDIYGDFNSRTPDDAVESQAECFVLLCKTHSIVGTNIISAYIKHYIKLVEEGSLSPNTVPNYVKPIKVLLDANDVVLHWKRLYHLYPRPVNSQDRAYTREEIQRMLFLAHDLTDKVILTMFSSAGFRLESWDYFTWQDIVFFRCENGKFKGAALLVYRGDPESYWTFITPEACEYLWAYREKWRSDLNEYPEPVHPLLRSTDQIYVKRLMQKGVRKRVDTLAKEAGLRPPLPPGRKRHAVKLDHGFRKYFNTMLRRAKVNYLDKEDMMGHKVGLEKNYERYVEEDFERFPEYQKAIPFLTISDNVRLKTELEAAKKEVRRSQEIQSAANAEMMRDLKELKELANKLKEAGVLEMLKDVDASDDGKTDAT